jgi:hypothetical protein
MLSWESGWTTAKPPDTITEKRLLAASFHCILIRSAEVGRTYGSTAWWHHPPQQSQRDRASAAQWRERGWRGHPSHRRRRGC